MLAQITVRRSSNGALIQGTAVSPDIDLQTKSVCTRERFVTLLPDSWVVQMAPLTSSEYSGFSNHASGAIQCKVPMNVFRLSVPVSRMLATPKSQS